MYSKPKQGSSLIPFLKIFKVDFENYEPYTPMSGADEETKEEEEKEEEPTAEEEETITEEETVEEEKPFDYQLGEILDEYYYGRFTNIDYEYDYEGISSTLNITLPEQTDGLRFYKGVQGQFYADWFNDEKIVNPEDIKLINRLFIEDLTFSEDGTQLSCKGADVLLDEEYQFDFHQMKRSKILEEMIKTAGLEPVVDPTGLIDDVIDYTNVTKSSSDSGTGDASGAPNISTMVKQACKGKKGAREKAEAVYQAMVDHLVYSGYSCSQFPHTNEGADQAWQKGAVNCADSAAIGRVAYTAAKLQARCVHGPNHFWCEVNIDGQWIASDVTGAEGAHCVRPLGKVYNGLSKDNDNGDWPSC